MDVSPAEKRDGKPEKDFPPHILISVSRERRRGGEKGVEVEEHDLNRLHSKSFQPRSMFNPPQSGGSLVHGRGRRSRSWGLEGSNCEIRSDWNSHRERKQRG